MRSRKILFQTGARKTLGLIRLRLVVQIMFHVWLFLPLLKAAQLVKRYQNRTHLMQTVC